MATDAIVVESHFDFRRLVEDHALANALVYNNTPLAFSFENPEHIVSSEALEQNPYLQSKGRLFEGEDDFFIVEPEIDSEEANISQYSFKNVRGALSCYYCTKNDQLDSYNWNEAEVVARWFAHSNMTSVVFRGLSFGQKIHHRGFSVYPIDVAFEYRLKLPTK